MSWHIPGNLEAAIREDMEAAMKALADGFTAHILGDGSERCSNLPAFDDEPEPLTADRLRKMINVLSSARPLVRLIEIDPYPVYGPARLHRRRRIQKKWLKRYGVKVVKWDYPMGDNVLIDAQRGVGYCHPHVARRVREMTRGEFY